MTLKTYKERLDKHDWFYMMSDDPRKYDSGYAEEQELRKLAAKYKTYSKVFKRKWKSVYKLTYTCIR